MMRVVCYVSSDITKTAACVETLHARLRIYDHISMRDVGQNLYFWFDIVVVVI